MSELKADLQPIIDALADYVREITKGMSKRSEKYVPDDADKYAAAIRPVADLLGTVLAVDSEVSDVDYQDFVAKIATRDQADE